MDREITGDELLFFGRYPQLVPIYDRLRTALWERYPDLTVKVSKTQISFRNKHIFAMASLPLRPFRGFPREYLLLSFGLGERRISPRVAAGVEPYPGRWTHHVPVADPSEIDAELLGWLDEAYQFSNAK